ncbi:MAG: ATP-dependent helicase [Peptococcaceae bacterium]|jgi:SNF2 family DNA or RNA helicase|nr:ATP-dependent helicase [Peptococcaceae bacterium]
MIVLHLAMYDGSWFLWGEILHNDESDSAKRGRPKTKITKTEILPGDVGPVPLKEALLSVGIETGSKKSRNLTAWLPSSASGPIGSRHINTGNFAIKEEPVLRPWRVTVLPLSPKEVIYFLSACIGKEFLDLGVMLGSDVIFWTKVIQFAAALTVRERFLPGVREEKGIYYAHWEPFLADDELKSLKQLAQAMPAVCQALHEDSEAPPVAGSFALLSQATSLMVDAIVREGANQKYPEASKGGGKAPDFDSIHDQWLYALQSPNGEMKDSPEVLARFITTVAEWKKKAFFLATAPFRFCFRLEEPKEDKDEWVVSYLLQSVDDPSLLIPVKEAWQADKKMTKLFKGKKISLHEFILTALGQGAAICPRIEESLKTALPTGYTLDTAGAYEFLRERAPVLQQAGFTVILPAWWSRKGERSRLRAYARVETPKYPGGGHLSLDSIVSFSWEVVLGEETLSHKELENLVKMKVPLVKMRGQWVEVNAQEIQTLLNQWHKKEGSVRTRDIVRMALGAGDTLGNIPFEGVRASGWIADLLEQLQGAAPWAELPAPQGLQGHLRPYQSKGYSWLGFMTRLGLGTCLADDMGLGKSIQTLALIQHVREQGEKRPVLIICPTSVLGNWQKEVQRFTPDLSFMVHHGNEREKEKSSFIQEVRERSIVISSYSLLHRDFELFREITWAGVVLDEAQNIKNSQTKQAQAARSLQSDWKVALTGTPVENNVGDLWSLMEFINPGFLGNQAKFKRDFYIPIQVNRNEAVAEKLKRITGPFILRRLKSDKAIINDLPEKMEIKTYCTLTKEQASLYAAVVREVELALEESEGMERKGLILATLAKLKQVCNHPAQFLKDRSSIAGRSGKLARLTEMCEEILAVGDRALIFTQFAEMGEILRKYLTETFGPRVLFLHGGVPKKERDRMVDLFQREEGPPLFILSLKAGGTGINLTKANHVIHFDRWWNPAVENQATDRAFRIGQTKNVQVYKFICAGTLEERIDEMIERKKEVAGQVVKTGEEWLTELSTAELKEIMALGREAIGE